ncbi:MAG: hypothetical protein HOV81_00250 [Kofleriaceae bacterium]|nr:hypothetical protein [Kofleriaceae bacterium]
MRRAALLLLVAGCASQDIVASSSDNGAPAYCTGTGPPVLVGDGITVGDGDGNPDDVCTGTVAVRTFKRALCTCEGYATSTPLVTDSFDGSVAPYAPGTAGTAGAVGIDGALSASAMVSIGGALAVAGTTGASFLVDATIARDLDVNGALGTNVAITAGGNAHVAGDIALASLAVSGTLTVPAAATLIGTVTAGTTVRAPVTIEPPCACEPTDLVDIGAFVANHRDDNNDASIGLSPARLTDYTGDVTLDLPCGIYYVGPVRGDGALSLRITGRVALLVDGDLTLTHPLAIELATQDAELDLMIGGLVSSNARIMAGDAAHPSRTRIYVGGSGTIELSGDSQIAANVYAPKSAVAMSAPSTVFGSLFVRRIDQAAPLTIHYDEDVLRADIGCLY